MSSRKIKTKKPPAPKMKNQVRPGGPINAAKPGQPPGPGPIGALDNLNPEQQAYIRAYQDLIAKLGAKVGKTFLGPAGTMEQGTQIVDELVVDVAQDCMSKFKGTMGLADLMAVFGSVIGYQAAISVVKGVAKPLPDARFVDAGKIFEAGVRLIYASTIANAQQQVKVVKNIPKVH